MFVKQSELLFKTSFEVLQTAVSELLHVNNLDILFGKSDACTILGPYIGWGLEGCHCV